MGRETHTKTLFANNMSPIVENVPTPRGSILHPTRASQVPCLATSMFLHYICFLRVPPLIPLSYVIGVPLQAIYLQYL